MSKLQPITQSVMHQLFLTTVPIGPRIGALAGIQFCSITLGMSQMCHGYAWILILSKLQNSQRNNLEYSNSVRLSWSIHYTGIIPG